jgi:tetratricopeptide (TPR) repeat protein
MKAILKIIVFFSLLIFSQLCFSQPIDEFIKKAEKFDETGDLEKAVKTMEEAIQKFPNESTAFSYLGVFKGKQAGSTKNFMEAGQLIGIAYEMLDKAVSLDRENPVARFHRGLIGVNVPPFLNKLNQAIEDLEYLIKIHNNKPNEFTTNAITNAYGYLAQGYQKNQEKNKAITSWQKVMELAPGTKLAETARGEIANMSIPNEEKKQIDASIQKKFTSEDIAFVKAKLKKEPDNAKLLLKMGKVYFDTGQFEKAEKVLKKSIQKDSTNVDVYKLLAQTLGEIAGKGYDKRIYNDTDFRTKLAFEVVKYTDKAVEIAANDLEVRLMRGSVGVMMPFFVGKLEQAIEDLKMVKNGDGSNEQKANAIYWLGRAFQKKATTFWIDVITEHAKTDAAKLAFQSFRPSVRHFEPADFQKPFLAIDFVIGFRDELPPQTAVWIEDENGKFVKTIYVSGFSGFAKEKQANLSDWAESSKFEDADVVTGASIDIGHHVYVWDLKDYTGKKVKNEEYVVKVEVAFWPSMEYQSVSANIMIGKSDVRIVKEKGNLIPYLELKYYSK